MPPTPWYERYFTADYWTFADDEYTAERTAAEVAYLADVLATHAPGRRVVDLGCGVGRHAVGLAREGFDVIGVDVSGYALRRAASAADAAGVTLDLRRVDLLGAQPPGWGLPDVDAAICVQAFGWGTDADQLRLLRAVRRLLPADGPLILDHSNVLAIARHYRDEAHADIGGTAFHFQRRYDPTTGRSSGRVDVRRPDGTTAVLPDDVRLYHPTEVATLLTRAGFAVARTDADFTAGATLTMDARYVQFVARPAPVVTSALDGHRTPTPPVPSPADDHVPGPLDLRAAPDEAVPVEPALAAAWASLPTGPAAVQRARRYDLADPYAAQRLAPLVAAYLGWPQGRHLPPERVTAGAGATGLLHALARLGDGGTVLVDLVGHPELPGATGGQVLATSLRDPSDAVAAVTQHRPVLTLVDRPGLLGPIWTGDQLRRVAQACATVGSVLVVDETLGAYLPPDQSAAPLTDELPGTVVIRSMSKGFCAGGLRVGYAVAAPDLADVVRQVAPPLAVSALALDLAAALLTQRDPLALLRKRIAQVKPYVEEQLIAAGLTPLPTDPRLPWLALPGEDGVRRILAARGVLAKQVPSLAPGGPPGALLRLSVPLSEARLAAFAAAPTAAAAGSATGRPGPADR
ncbi:histidinol-phosphate/aromatic aminotransferase/cobyric acid decarboxylase-like protein [Micromonospora sp. Llam0]|uniref:aminotransferase class I/II-fold pyridoxal phosphate-dependent enzyme n=1 Tax=Micromonospora sp. Llam0 TaxID=2485143 RepID=UPI000F4801A4|nr:aminotransferase class I/II-fold pyridoxal phosphate-dependent enzyme [Micromonospora sp. Llam0]ROO63349.1 histidinol-phosphate/aromatic aminotransferase/cobyric acid decarboxylase-like protein [Micromonospora sp. Llam0]